MGVSIHELITENGFVINPKTGQKIIMVHLQLQLQKLKFQKRLNLKLLLIIRLLVLLRKMLMD